MEMRKPKTSKLTILLLITAIAVLCSVHGAEPRYKGTTLSKWLTIYQAAEEGSSTEQQAEVAVRTIGTNTLPYLTKWIASGDLDVATRAKLGFKILGPAAAPAVPTLAPMLISTNEVLALTAGPALASIGSSAVPVFLSALTNRSYKISLHVLLALPDLGTNARPAFPFLLTELKHPNHFYRERAADALGALHIEPEAVVPALTALLTDASQAARFHAVNGLAEFGPSARSAAPAILKIMQEDENMRPAARKALSRIAPEVLTNVPAH